MRRKTQHTIIPLIVMLFTTAACGDDATGPSVSYDSIAGNYSGFLTGVSQGVVMDATFTLTIQQDKGTVSGSYGLVGTLNDGIYYVNVQGTGALQGTAASGNNPSVNIAVTPGFCPDRTASFSGSYDSANRRLTLTGPVQFFDENCLVVLSYSTTVILNR